MAESIYEIIYRLTLDTDKSIKDLEKFDKAIEKTTADTGGLEKQLTGAEKETKKLAEQLEGSAEKVKKLSSGAQAAGKELGKFSGKTALLTAGMIEMGVVIGVVVVALASLAVALKAAQLTKQQRDDEMFLIKALGQRKDLANELIKQAKELQKTRLFSDNETIKAQALLATMGFTVKEIKKLIPLVQDLSSDMKIGLSDAALKVGKTIKGTSNELSGYNVQVSDSIKGTERFNEVVSELDVNFRGYSEYVAGDGKLSVDQFKNAWTELLEDIGEPVLEWLLDVVFELQKVVDWGTRLAETFGDIRDAYNDSIAGEVLFFLTAGATRSPFQAGSVRDERLAEMAANAAKLKKDLQDAAVLRATAGTLKIDGNVNTFDAHELEDRLLALGRIIELEKAFGNSTIALEREKLQIIISLSKKGTEERKDAINDLAVFEALTKKNAAAEALKAAEAKAKAEEDAWLKIFKIQKYWLEKVLAERKLIEDFDKAELKRLEKLSKEFDKILNKSNEFANKQGIKDLEKAREQGDKDTEEFKNNLTKGELKDFLRTAEEGSDIAKDLMERIKTIREQEIEAILEFKDIAIGVFHDIAQAKIDGLDVEIRAQENKTNRALELAKLGNTEIIKIEQERLDKLYEQRQKAVQQQRALDAISIISGATVALVKALDTVPPFNVISFFTVLGLLASIGGAVASLSVGTGFFEGEEYVQGQGGIDTIPARLTKGERVVTADKNREYYDALHEIHSGSPLAALFQDMAVGKMRWSDISSTDNSVVVRQNNEDVVKSLKSLERAVKGQERTTVKIDKDGFSATVSKYISEQDRIKKYAN